MVVGLNLCQMDWDRIGNMEKPPRFERKLPELNEKNERRQEVNDGPKCFRHKNSEKATPLQAWKIWTTRQCP